MFEDLFLISHLNIFRVSSNFVYFCIVTRIFLHSLFEALWFFVKNSFLPIHICRTHVGKEFFLFEWQTLLNLALKVSLSFIFGFSLGWTIFVLLMLAMSDKVWSVSFCLQPIIALYYISAFAFIYDSKEFLMYITTYTMNTLHTFPCVKVNAQKTKGRACVINTREIGAPSLEYDISATEYSRRIIKIS